MIELQDLAAKSDQMNAIDFVKPMIFKVSRVDYFPKQQQPIFLHLEGYEGRPYKPCKSMLRGLSQAWGMDEQLWVGALLELYCDPSVKWAGKEAGGIRISGVSRINKDHSFTVQLNRQQRIIHTFKKLEENTAIKKEFVLTHYVSDIQEAKSNEEIDSIVAKCKSEFGRDALLQIKDDVIKARSKFEPKEE